MTKNFTLTFLQVKISLIPCDSRRRAARWHLMKKLYYENIEAAEPTSKSLLDALPVEVLLHILSFLDVANLKRFSLVSKLAHKLSDDDTLWKVCVNFSFLPSLLDPLQLNFSFFPFLLFPVILSSLNLRESF